MVDTVCGRPYFRAITTSNILSESEVKAKYQTMLDGFYHLPADVVDRIPMGDREAVTRVNIIAFFKNRDGITITEKQLFAILD
jgi:hypothetical protein